MKYLGVLGLLIFVLMFYALYGLTIYNNKVNTKVDNVDTVYVEKRIYIDTFDTYNAAINHLKEYEGFRSNVYIDTDGSRTIGYGHHLSSNENYTNIDEQKATEILKSDLNERIDFVKENYNLKDNQSLALGMLAFNIGTGNLTKYIREDKLLEGNNIDKILNYCHYKTEINGKTIVVASSSLKERREFELHIYKQ